MKRSPFHRPHARLQVVASTTDEVEVMLYDEIGFWGITADEFRRQLDGITASTINLRINSPGGDVFDGLAMYNALREHPASVVVHVDAVAASMAGMVAMAGDEIRMAENAFIMIHDPWALVIGNSTDLRKEADLLDKISGSLLMAYMAQSGADEETVRGWMAEETWFTAAEALDAGLIHEVVSEEEDTAAQKIAAAFDLSIYAHVPEPLRGVAQPEPTARDLERALRDVGLSQIAAKQFISAGRAASAQRDVVVDGERDVTPEPVVPPIKLYGI